MEKSSTGFPVFASERTLSVGAKVHSFTCRTNPGCHYGLNRFGRRHRSTELIEPWRLEFCLLLFLFLFLFCLRVLACRTPLSEWLGHAVIVQTSDRCVNGTSQKLRGIDALCQFSTPLPAFGVVFEHGSTGFPIGAADRGGRQILLGHDGLAQRTGPDLDFGFDRVGAAFGRTLTLAFRHRLVAACLGHHRRG